MIKTHELKTDPDMYDDIISGRKNFDIRYNDRDFRRGERLILRRTKYKGYQMQYSQNCPLIYTGERLTAIINYVLKGPIYGLEKGWCIMSLKDINPLCRMTPVDQEEKP